MPDHDSTMDILNEKLRLSFDRVALLYNEVRPKYPDELFKSLIQTCRITPDSKLLEIGPGTGQATKPLAVEGFNIVAIEIGEALSEIARREMDDYKRVQIVHGSFEDSQLHPNSFDLVYAATAFHWIDPAVKFTKTHRLLKDDGFLAIIHTHHVSDEKGDAFVHHAKPIYDKYHFTDREKDPRLPEKSELSAESYDNNLFTLIDFQLFPVTIVYSADKYTKLLNTFSNHLTADDARQKEFYHEIARLIEKEFLGQIEKHFAMSLSILKKR